MKPTFICIGTQKGGTTSLIKYLNIHPEIYCKFKESHFFDKPQEYKITTNDYVKYEKSFKTKKTLVGEKTPSYCYLQFAIYRIHTYNPNIKLILILREPISRAYSHYNMALQRRSEYIKKNIFLEFNKEKQVKLSSIKKNGVYFITRGFYDEQIEYILSQFSRENLYIGISEEIQQNLNIEYNKIYNFLGGKNIEITKNLDTHIRNYKKNIPKKLEKILSEIYKPHNENLYKLLGRKIEIWEDYYKSI